MRKATQTLKMQFLLKQRRSPEVYLAETTQYVNDLQRVTLLRDKCSDPTEREEYDNVLHCMREVLLFMNHISQKDRARLPDLQPQT